VRRHGARAALASYRACRAADSRAPNAAPAAASSAAIAGLTVMIASLRDAGSAPMSVSAGVL
jgi:hypothetical protein